MKDIILQRLAEQVRSMRIQRGMSQIDLAAAAGVGRKTIIEVEKGAPGTALGTFVSVLEVMGGELAVVPASKPTTAELQAMLGLSNSQFDIQHIMPKRQNDLIRGSKEVADTNTLRLRRRSGTGALKTFVTIKGKQPAGDV